MATPGAEFVTVGPKAQVARSADTDTELRDLEKEIAARRDWPLPSLLMRVVEGVSSITLAHGAAIALRDQWGVVCRASRGEAPVL